jgi:hypothetical protein
MCVRCYVLVKKTHGILFALRHSPGPAALVRAVQLVGISSRMPRLVLCTASMAAPCDLLSTGALQPAVLAAVTNIQ